MSEHIPVTQGGSNSANNTDLFIDNTYNNDINHPNSQQTNLPSYSPTNVKLAVAAADKQEKHNAVQLPPTHVDRCGA